MANSLVKKEWRRLNDRLRRKGADETTSHVISLIRTEKYPLVFSQQLCEKLLKLGEYDATGRVLKAIKESGATHPLIDEHYGAWLWCIGKRKDAITFALKSARYWQKSYLFDQVGVLNYLMGKLTGSASYRKKADYYRHLAADMAEKEGLKRSQK